MEINMSHPAHSQTISQTDNHYQILVAEDDISVRNLLTLSLRRNGYQVIVAENGREALTQFFANAIDLVILDIEMPLMDGRKVCSELRKQTDIPIIMLTARSRSEEIVDGLNLGADNYMTKPFSLRELNARVQAVLRRAERVVQMREGTALKHGDIILNDNLREVTVRGEPVHLTTTEYRLLQYFMQNPDVPISKEKLLSEIWEYEGEEDLNLVRVTIRRLRSKIELTPSQPAYLKTVRKLGYSFDTSGGISKIAGHRSLDHK